MHRSLKPVLIGLAVAVVLQSCDDGNDEAFTCDLDGPGWSDGDVPINRRHVFCGVVDRDGDPKGVHATDLVPGGVVAAIEGRRDEGSGIYSARVRFANGRVKRSTFFPDACSIDQIERSIVHAYRNPSGRHRSWGTLGPSAPSGGGAEFCLDDERRAFTIRFHDMGGRINTAFPN